VSGPIPAPGGWLDYSISALSAAAREPLCVGRTWAADLTLQDSAGEPVDLTGWLFTFALRAPGLVLLRKSGETTSGAPSARVVIVDAAAGLVRWRFDPQDAADLSSLLARVTPLPLPGARGVGRVSLELSARLPSGGGDKRLAGGWVDIISPLVEAL
jgi:hypothetical protein